MSDSVSGRKRPDDGTQQGISRGRGVRSFDMSVYTSSAEESVRIKGSMDSSVYKSSEEYLEYICDPCNTAGDHVEAHGFCTDCKEYLCGMCFKSHSRGKATRNHTLLNKDNMPRNNVKTCDPCETAGDKIDVVGYCDSCEEYLCSNCFRSHSRSKATKHHTLIDKDKMPGEFDSAVASSMSNLYIQREDAGYQKSNEEYSYIRDINVKAASDTTICYIISMTLVSNTELVVADFSNVSLKLVDVTRNVIKGTLVLESEPFGLTTVSKNKVAVSLCNIYVIKFITTSGSMSVERNIKLMGLCLDIEYLNGKLYASFENPVNFQILQASGAVYKTIKPDAEVLKHCPNASYIAVSPNESLIYVSNWNSKKVMCIDIDGNMVSMYQSELKMPEDIAISPFGSVYLCDREHHVVYKMKPDLSDATVILGPGDDLSHPFTMCFSVEKQHLYISSASDEAESCNNLKVFKWK